MSRSSLMVAAGVALSLAAFAGASTPWSAEMTATAVQAGHATSAGTLSLLLQEHGGSEGALADVHFTIAASRLRLETDSASASAGAAALQVNPTTQTQDFGPSTVEGVAIRPAYRFIVVPLDAARPPTLSAESSCSGLKAPDDEAIVREAKVQKRAQRPTIAVDAGEAVEWTDCSASAVLVIRGDFQLSFWEVDAHITSEGSEVDAPSGRSTEYAPADAVLSRDLEQHVQAWDGHLRVPLNGAPGARVLLGPSAQASTTTVMQLRDGTLQGSDLEEPVTAETLVLEGRLQAILRRDTFNRLVGTVTGTPAAVSADGIPMLNVRVAATGGVPWLAVGMIAGAGLAALAALAYRYPTWYYRHMESSRGALGTREPESRREQRALGYWALARHARDHGHPRRAGLYASLAIRLAPHVPDHWAMRSWARREAGRHAAALRDHEQLADMLPPGNAQAVNACLAAASCAQLGRSQDALQWLRKAEEESIDVLQDEILNPEFASLRGEKWFATRRTAVESATRLGPRYDPSFA